MVFKLSSAQELKKEYFATVETFVNCIKNDDTDLLKTLIAYPLKRENPLSDIKNEYEFEKRYNEVFDDSLKSLIISSDIKTDWSAVGWRGIMFNHGSLWLGYDGRLISVNYQSKFERSKSAKLIEKDQTLIHESINKFLEPILIIETRRFKIRIDKLHNNQYRYASWSADTKMSEKPDLILTNGKWIPEGSGGNHRYEFTNGIYKYECVVNVLKEKDTPPAELIVYRKNKEILNEAGQIKRR